jgi:cytochrome c-type biogenesis protein CcsB
VSQWIGIALVLYWVSAMCYVGLAVSGRDWLRWPGLVLMAAGFLAHTAAASSRVFAAGRLPLANTYETLLLFAWVLVPLSYGLERRYRLPTLNAFTLPLVVVALAALSLPQLSSEIEPLVPSLKSNWLLVHVLACFVAYAAFGVAFAASVVFVVSRRLRPSEQRLRRQELLDAITYRAISFGFPLLTLGIATGAVWANACWGRYWNWDPKETWALVTWLIYGVFLHLRLTTLWRGRWAAWAAIGGFVCVIVTYLGVNLLYTSIHAYT